MMYLIAQLSGWLLLTAGFSGLIGWAFAALRDAPAEAALRRERDRLMRDLRSISVENASLGAGASAETEREMDTLRRRADLDAARIAEMARALAGARDRAQEANGRVAELERAAEQHQAQLADLSRTNEESARAAEPVVALPVAQEEPALRDWRLRYFEQRVRYLETHAREATPAPAPEADVNAAEQPSVDPSWQWRARTAEARAAHAEQELRAAAQPAAIEATQAEEGPFAANAEADMLLRWRMLYLEKRVSHLQGEQALEALQLASAMDAEDSEKWKWRARYLEARTRHLEQRLAEEALRAVPAPAVAAPAPAIAPEPEPAASAPRPAVRGERPPKLLAARGGLPDDLTLIDGVSGIQQTTLNALGVFHFEQMADWTPAHVAWIDNYLRLRGRIAEEEWVEQAQDLVERGVDAIRRPEEQDA